MEQLLILSTADARLRRRIERKAKVVQEGSDKLLVVEGPEDAVRQAAGLPGVSTPESLAAGTAATLSPGEQMFLAAWRQRKKGMATKKRIGHGLNWGAKGFRAP